LRLAWAEGLATWLSMRLQIEPASTEFGMTWPAIPLSGDTHYQDTEDASIDDDMENMANTQGYASENSIAAMLWDLTDTPGESAPPGGAGQATDRLDFSPKTIWDLITSNLPCNPCDRVDRFWNAVMSVAGVSQTMLDAAETLVLNEVAPELTAPDHERMLSGGVSPTFQWNANGDPSASHNPNRFFLVISKNNFQSDLHIFPTNGQPIQTTQYQIPDADYRALLQGETDETVFSWVVIGYREADGGTRIPEGSGFLVSNSRTFQVRAYHIRLTWDKIDTDVDLHFRPPDGASEGGAYYANDCAFYNPTPDWGVLGDATDNPSLDRDCISSCTEENITIDKVTAPGTYRVVVHYWSDHGNGGTTATVEVFHNGNPIGTWSQYLAETDDVWEVFSFTVSASGKIEAVAPTGKLSKQTLPADLPRFLQKPGRKK